MANHHDWNLTRFTLRNRFKDTSWGYHPNSVAIAEFLSNCDARDVGEALLILEKEKGNPPAASVDLPTLVGCIRNQDTRMCAMGVQAMYAAETYGPELMAEIRARMAPAAEVA